jgi:hypothetical protein
VLSAPVDALPVIGWEPLQSPDAAHEVAFAELQLSAEELPLTTLVGLAVKVTVGAACTVAVVCGVVVADDGADDVEPELQAVTVTVTARIRAICVLARASLDIVGSSFYCANSDPTTGSQRRSHGTDDNPGCLIQRAVALIPQPLSACIAGGIFGQEHCEIIAPRVACLQLFTLLTAAGI